jgi:hypothetical protein
MKGKALPSKNTNSKQQLRTKASSILIRSRTIKDGINSSSDIQSLLHIEHLQEQIVILEKDLQAKNAAKSKHFFMIEDQNCQIKFLEEQVENQTISLNQSEDDKEILKIKKEIETEQREVYKLQSDISKFNRKISKTENFAEEKATVLQKLLSEYLALNVDSNSNSKSDSENYHMTPSKSTGTRIIKKSQFSQLQFVQQPADSKILRTKLLSVK